MSRLPDFIIIGAQRCGTTAFYHSLISHSGIAKAVRKEVHYFDLYYNQGRSWYSNMFVEKRGRISGEASPYYICLPYVPERIWEMVPAVKIIAMLRNPVDRAYGHYHHETRAGHETRTFEEAVAREHKELAGYEEELWTAQHTFWREHNWHSYQIRGYYAQQLKWFKDVFPEDQLLIICSEDYFADRQKHLDLAVEWLGLETEELEMHPKPTPQYKEPMKEETRQQLIEHFRPHNKALAELTGRDFQWDI